ncbi:uncharacterized protein LOC128993931 [Macrosteles quadrilineatus]|uniref:uncharacterized protein LOC128993931 n=1 Tax=Macrosteles quadrilineatus TaxID=74068 RepID=UPI0023E243CA|nr:uncharacterized protein LOC128993931 [Macrosteles quadrilineatus]
MEPFHHILWMSVLVFLVLETAAVLQRVKVDFPPQTNPELIEIWKEKTGGKTSWEIETDVLKSDEEYESRHAIYKDKVLAIHVKQTEIEKYKTNAAAEFAKKNIKNGVFLTVAKDGISIELVQKYKLNWIGFRIESKDESYLRWDPDPNFQLFEITFPTEGTTGFQAYLKRKASGKPSWFIYWDEVKTEKEYENRHENYKDKVLAVYLKPYNAEEYQARAAAEFARNNVNNGIFLTVKRDSFSNEFKRKHGLYWSDESIDLKDKFQIFFITDKAEYEERYKTYKGKAIYTLFHKIDKDKVVLIRNVEKNVLEGAVEDRMNWLRDKWRSIYIWVVLLVVHVDVVGGGFIDKLCPIEEKPHGYPRMYYESSGKVISVIGGYDDITKYTVSCQVMEQSKAEESSTNTPEEDDTNTPEEDDTNTPEEDDTNTPEEDDTNTPEEDDTNTPEEDGTNT